ncbi:MAG: hypothetical protein ACXVEU_21095, partial [Nocardioidaceae bacterium]
MPLEAENRHVRRLRSALSLADHLETGTANLLHGHPSAHGLANMLLAEPPDADDGTVRLSPA